MLSTIRLDSKGDLVKVAEYLLNYVPLKEATSIYDSLFMDAVKEWQAKNELDADGIIGPKTWTKIADTTPTCSTSKNKKSVYTCAIQTLLGGLDVDGDYGTKTKQAVAAFQSASGLQADGICGPKTWAKLIGVTSSANTTPSGANQVITGDKVLNDCVKYLQWDSKWKKIKYSTHTSAQTIGNSGCGTTSMAMIMATWIDPTITPVEMSALAVKKGYRTYNSGTAWGFFKYIFKNYDGFQKYVETNSVNTLKSALREGALAICSMNANDNHFWTSAGHYIVARGCDDTYIYANDPNNKTTPRKQTAAKFQKCMKQAFIFWPIVKEPEPEKKETKIETPVEKTTTELHFDVNPDGAIIDISKWQGNINFKALKPKVGLVIARASCGSDKDVKIDEYAQAMIENRIPFGVYCYSYAGTIEKARDEAQKMVSYVEKYQPLFYIMDAEETKVTNEAIKAFADELRKQTKRRIGCYVAHNRYNTYKYDTVRNLFDITWIPRYGKNDGTIEGATKPAYECDLWQYTSTAKIDGINGNVDKNITMKEDRDLKWFLTE